MQNYNYYTTDELESMRDRLQDEIAERFDDEQFCSQAEYAIDMIEDELENREVEEQELEDNI